ncbi:Molybdenum cofactor biosynthesis protein MoaB [hydrothermal vent metagenome]|uniref:Molybdenum cofactor biosynthesis protein MoaB n=1 Tax=hydrothermal vent metagenome TaxID=652676 RepID=A0A3B1AA91_9ZZZZ
MPLDNNIEFLPLNIAILTVSDTRTLDNDTSGQILIDRLTNAGHKLAARAIVKDEKSDLSAKLSEWIRDEDIQVIISTGGTGLTGRDITPEVFHSLYDKEIEGFGEIFRLITYKLIGTSTMQSRATGGVAGGTYMFALPGSNGACKDGWDNIFKEQLDIRFRPCNFAEMMPRLIE